MPCTRGPADGQLPFRRHIFAFSRHDTPMTMSPQERGYDAVNTSCLFTLAIDRPLCVLRWLRGCIDVFQRPALIRRCRRFSSNDALRHLAAFHFFDIAICARSANIYTELLEITAAAHGRRRNMLALQSLYISHYITICATTQSIRIRCLS